MNNDEHKDYQEAMAIRATVNAQVNAQGETKEQVAARLRAKRLKKQAMEMDRANTGIATITD